MRYYFPYQIFIDIEPGLFLISIFLYRIKNYQKNGKVSKPKRHTLFERSEPSIATVTKSYAMCINLAGCEPCYNISAGIETSLTK